MTRGPLCALVSSSRVALALTAALALGACGSAPVLHFYSLRAQADDSRTATTTTPPAANAALLVVGPVSLPPLLDRPEWIVSTGANQVRVLEQQRWAQPLEADIAQALAEQLNRRLDAAAGLVATAEVAGWPVMPRLRLQLDVLRFDTRLDGGGEVHDAFRWAVSCVAAGRQTPPRSGQSQHSGQVSGAIGEGSFAALAQAHARSLQQAADDIAPVLREMNAACARP